MKRNLFILFISCLFLLISCSNDSTRKIYLDNNTPDQSSPSEEISETLGKSNILKGTLILKNWYVPNVRNDTQYFRFSDSKIYYKLSYNQNNSVLSGLGSSKEGNLTFLNTDLSKFTYRWDGSIYGSDRTESILILDNDILVLSNGFECSNEIGKTYICYKDINAYTDNVPYMGLGNIVKDNYSEWFIFTPAGNCYKRYLNLHNNELLIVDGIWEKTGEKTYKIYWNKNDKQKYDILKENKLYQNANENSSSVPITLYISRY